MRGWISTQEPRRRQLQPPGNDHARWRGRRAGSRARV